MRAAPSLSVVTTVDADCYGNYLMANWITHAGVAVSNSHAPYCRVLMLGGLSKDGKSFTIPEH